MTQSPENPEALEAELRRKKREQAAELDRLRRTIKAKKPDPPADPPEDPEDLDYLDPCSDVGIESIRDGELELAEDVVEIMFDNTLQLPETLVGWVKPEILGSANRSATLVRFASLNDGRAVKIRCKSGLELVYGFDGRRIS